MKTKTRLLITAVASFTLLGGGALLALTSTAATATSVNCESSVHTCPTIPPTTEHHDECNDVSNYGDDNHDCPTIPPTTKPTVPPTTEVPPTTVPPTTVPPTTVPPTTTTVPITPPTTVTPPVTAPAATPVPAPPAFTG